MPAKDSWGGPAASEPPFVDALRSAGLDTDTETYVYGDRETSTPVISRAVRVIRTALRFRKRIAASSYDIIHLNTAFDKKTILRDAISVFLMRPRNAKIFLKIHGAGAHLISSRSFFYARLIRFLDRRTAGYGIFTREELASLLAHGLDKSKFHLIKNIIELPVPEVVRHQKRPDEVFELLFVSRFIATKGLLETIRSCAILRDRGLKFRLTCIGDGPIRVDADRLVGELDLLDHVRFTGYLPESSVTEYLFKSDIFVFPTRHTEGFPIALFKAVIAGLPIVTTAVRASAEYFADPDNCLFSTDSPDDIADKVAQLILDRTLRERMIVANRAFAPLLARERVASEYVQVYERLK
jgi:glycosyltransferase involved in cell wall biosynthesis